MAGNKTDRLNIKIRDFFGINPSKYKKILLYTVIFWAAAHGYRFLNNLYTGDTLTGVFQDDIVWQRALGRFMQTFSLVFRGVVVAPWLLFVISIFLFSTATFFVTEVLKIEKPIFLFFTCGILSCNITITCANAVYTPWIDIYGMAFLLASFGVWLFLKDNRWCYALGIFSFISAMGFYQCYIDVAFTLFLIIIVKDLTEKKTFKEIGLKVLKIICGLAASGVGYYILFKAVIKIHNGFEANSYNGLAGVLDFENHSIFNLFAGAYKQFFFYLMNQGTFLSTHLLGRRVSDAWDVVVGAIVILTLALIIIELIILNKANKPHPWQIALQVVLLLLFAPVSNFVYIISKGFEYELMIYSFFFLFIFMLCLAERIGEKKLHSIKTFAIVIPLVILIWNNIVYSNQIYFKIDMQDRAAQTYATQLLYDIERTEGYDIGDTQVLFVGSPNLSTSIDYPEYLKDLTIHSNYKTAFTYINSLPFYIKSYLAASINILETEDYPDEAIKMPVYPEEGSIQFINDVLVVKIADLD